MYLSEKQKGNIEWLEDVKKDNYCKTLSSSDINYFIGLLKYLYHECYNDPNYIDPFFHLKRAIEKELDENYYWAVVEYEDIYESLKNISSFSYSKKIEVKNFFINKITRLRYEDADISFRNKNYTRAINRCENGIEDDFVKNDTKYWLKKLIVESLFNMGDIDKKALNYNSAIINYEKALNYLNSNYELYEAFKDGLIYKKESLSYCYNEKSIKIWSDYDVTKMEESINYRNKSKKLLGKELKDDLNVYYYLYKATYEIDDSNKINYISQAQNSLVDNDLLSFMGYWTIYRNEDLSGLINSVRNIKNLKNEISEKNSIISNLKFKFDSLCKDVHYVQVKIDAHNTLINSKNDNITALNKVADDLVENTGIINNDTEKTINEEKNKVNEVEKNIKEEKNFIVVMKELEKQKNEEIQSFRNNNKALEQKNKQLMGMLTILESKLN